MFKRFISWCLAFTMVLSCFSGVTLVSADETNEVLDSVLELYYDFDDVDGTTVPDKSGKGNDGTLLNGATIVNAVQAKGNVLSLDNTGITGTNAQGLGLPTELFAGLDDVTLVMDVRLADTKNWTGILAAGSGRSHYMILANEGSPQTLGGTKVGITNATVYGGSNVDGTEERIYANANTKLPVGKWVRMAFTHSADDSAKLYIDNELVAEGTLATSLKDLAVLEGNQVRIGSNHIWPDPGLDGRIDNVRVYSAALTAEQMEAIPWVISNESVGEVEFPELGDHGLKADYYTFDTDSLSYLEYKGTYVEPNIESSDMESTLTARAGANDAVGAIWTGRIVAPEDGKYTFYTYSDNGIRVYIDGERIINWWVNQWDVEQISSTVEMKAGEAHDIKVEWFEATGGSHVTLRWKNDQTIAKQPVPASAFYLPTDFNAPIVNTIDTSNAQLDRGAENFGGTLVLNGKNLAAVTDVEIVYSNGASLSGKVYAEISAFTDNTLSIEVPEDLRAGSYSLKLIADDIVTTANATFTVLAAEGESDRPEHPRPDWHRADWKNLNGWWDFAFDADEVGLKEAWYNGEKEFDMQINVPFPWESALSGVANTSYRGQVWYQRELNLDESWLADGKTVHIYFGAVDAKCIVYVNGKEVGSHNGGYTQFEFDITEYVNAGSNTITLWVEDKASYGYNGYPALVGKQGHNAPCGYTHTSGIWQTVYVESRTETYLDYAHANPDIDTDSVTYDLSITTDAAQKLTVEYDFESKLWIEAAGVDVATGSNFSGSQAIEVKAGTSEITLAPIVIDNVKLWSDVTPNLYYGTLYIRAEDGTILDQVDTYFGMREVYVDKYDGRDYEYIYLNGHPVFMSGLLDQGFWEEGIYTAPSEEALKYDVLAMKELGFNTLRKHLKIEDPLQYYWSDKLGVFIWQDMPHATAMNASAVGDETPGRPIYEEALLASLNRDYNRPSVVLSILFNETWGINHNAPKAADGKSTHEWMQSLYYMVKDYNPNLLVEDMSACNNDHIQPTDINTFHMYPNGYASTKSIVTSYANGQYYGSGSNFWGDFTQENEPFLNSEYGGVAAFDGDYDVSLCFKYMTDIQRMFENLNGYIYTEPYDIEYERNGIMTYDRRVKEFPYDEVAYGGDMTILDLNQPNYVGIDAEPAAKVAPSSLYVANAVAMNWSGELFEDAVLKWRFDATDVYGNAITTDLSGEMAIEYPAYTAETVAIKFVVPDEKCVGTLTVWIEAGGRKIAKNFVNLIVTGTTKDTEVIDADTVALRDSEGTQELSGTGALTYEYAIPEGFDVNDLKGLRMIVEASAVKASTTNYGITNSAYSQTTPGSERPSDMTVTVNGIELDTIYLPDNPRDIRGTLTFDEGLCGGDSAGNFGYLVNINVPEEQMDAVQAAIAEAGKIVVSYEVKEDAENQNGLRIYDDESGRYAVNPTVILNPNDLTANEDGVVKPNAENYLVSATLDDGNYISIRGGIAYVTLNNGVITLSDREVLVGAGKHIVTVRVFDDHYQVYVDNNPEAVIDLYDYMEYEVTTVSTDGTDLVVSPDKAAEGYDNGEAAPVNKEALKAEIAEANARKESNYTELSWRTFEKALKEAKAVLADETATQKQVDAAVKALVNATAYLEKVLALVASYDMSSADGKLIDTTGNGHDANLVGITSANFAVEDEDIALVMTGQDGQYVEIPAGLIKEEQFAIDVTFKTSTRGNYYMWCLGTKEGQPADNHVFVGPKSGISASGVTGPIRAGVKFNGTEHLFGGGYGGVVEDDVYTKIRLEFNAGVMKLFVNGEQTSLMNTYVSIQDILALAEADTPGVSGYIGKSLWSADRDFTGTITQFDIYATVDDADVVDPAPLPYVDVTKDDWFYDAVYYNYFARSMTGKTATIFAPGETLTRAELVSILYRISGEPKVEYEAVFPDVAEDDWFAKAVVWAKQQDIVHGYGDGKFGPTDSVAREQIAIMMYNYAVAKEYKVDQRDDLGSFTDASSVSEYAKDAMQWAVGAGVITGKEDGTKLDPYGVTSRAECAAIIQKFMTN